MRVSDIAKAGSPDDVRAALAEREQQLRHSADRLLSRTELGAASRVLGGIARATARQLAILRSSFDHPIEVSASACRTVFELNVLCRYARLSDAYMDAVITWRASDETALLKGALRLSDGFTPQAEQVVRDRVTHIEQKLQQYGLNAAPPVSLFKMAEAACVEEEYKALYGFYSKYVHATGWLVCANDAERDCYEYRQIFLIQSQTYASDTHSRVIELLDRND